MYIKQVIIEGFKSYRDQTSTEPFSSGINVVVGANGAGKSNFFHAIRFVLDDLFTTTLRQEDRERLLHEGAGHAVQSAYVEVVFDNSDGRLPVDKEEVRLRRSIGLKKDEYQLNKRVVTKTEVTNLLETAGFSRANPYYVVQQGKIMAMANMKDSDRLELLKEIGGTRVYEERRRESLKLMRDCETKRATIQSLIEQLDGRLRELDEERSELAAYQAADRRRRALEYGLLGLEAREVRGERDAVEAAARASSAAAGAHRGEAAGAERELQASEARARGLRQRHDELERRKKELDADKATFLQRRAALELDVRELERGISAARKNQATLRRDLSELGAAVEERRGALAALEGEAAAARREEAGAAAALAAAEAKRQALFAKQGRRGQFKSAAERDAALTAEIKALDQAEGTMQEMAMEAGRQAAIAEAGAQAAHEEAEREREAIAALEAELVAAAGRAAAAAEARDTLAARQKALWRDEADLDSKKRAVGEELARWQRALEGSTSREVLRGAEAAVRLAAEHGLSGVHGTLGELVGVPGPLTAAAEVTAGNALFYVVVDDDGTAAQLAALLARSKAGRASFMPLNCLARDAPAYPTQYGTDVVPLASKLEYDDRFAAAVLQVFGKTLVCRSLELATRVGQEVQLNCVTMDGDQVERRGALRGGFVDARRSRLEALREIRGLREQAATADAALAAVRQSLASVQQELALAGGELTAAQAEQAHLRARLPGARAALKAARLRADAATAEATSRRSDAEAGGVTLEGIGRRRAALRAELGAPLVERLSAAEEAALAGLADEVAALEEAAAAARSAREALDARGEALRAALASNLGRQKQDLEDELAGGGPAAEEQALASATQQLANVSASLEEVYALGRSVEAELDSGAAELAKVEGAMESAHEALDRATHAAEAAALEERAQLTQSAALGLHLGELERRVRALGTLPPDAFEAQAGASAAALRARLKEVNAELRSFSHVNRKALDQHAGFAEQRDDLARRKRENDRGEEKIRQLIATLDLRKDEALERTFKGVARNFRDIFAVLVPGGRGEVVMQKRVPGLAGDEGGHEGRPATDGALERYVGVKVRVAFGAGGEALSLRQLSGGQKTLVALALILAIQRCDPAPFYLFDEIDAALDPQHRSVVAGMLQAQAHDARQPTQFIITTFHPQLVAVADRVYGVSHANRISRVSAIEQEDAMAFLRAGGSSEEGDEPSGGAVSAAHRSSAIAAV